MPSRLWAYQPGTFDGLFDLMREATSAHGLDIRQRGILVAACASSLGDSYCSLSWGSKLAEAADSQTASAVLRGDDDGLTTGERAMADWLERSYAIPTAPVEQTFKRCVTPDTAMLRSSRSRCSSRCASRSPPSTMRSARAPMPRSAPRRPKPFSRQ